MKPPDIPIVVDTVIGVNCVCGQTHIMTKSVAELLLQAYINGDAQYVSGDVVESYCLKDIFDKIIHKRRAERLRIN